MSISDARFGADPGLVCTDEGPGGVYHPAPPHMRHCLDVPVSGDLLGSLPSTQSRTLATISGKCSDLAEGDTIMAKGMTATELLAIYEALDESRKQELVDHALELIEEQRDARRTEQRI